MATPKTAKKALPPYVPYKTFSTFLDGLKIALPAEIDRSVMPTFSGAMQGQLLNSLRYLDLIDEEGLPDLLLHDLVKHKGDEEKSAHRSIIKNAYKFLFGNFNLLTSTPRMLEQAFVSAGAQGDTVRKCVAFFLSYAKANALPMSPHLKAPRARATGRRKRGTNGTGTGIGQHTPEPPASVSEKSMSQLLLDILDLKGMTDIEQQAVWTLIKFLKKQRKD